MNKTSSYTRREKIYDAYAKNLSLVAERFNLQFAAQVENETQLIDYPFYVCPLCMRGFNKESLNQEHQNPLTIEDLPPKSVGGSPKILTCKNCNSKSGHLLDGLILASLKTEAFLQKIPDSEVQSTITFEEGFKYKAITKISNDHGLRFQILAKDVSHIEKHFKQLNKDWDGYKFNFNFHGPNPEKLKIAYLRIGLLLAFYYFGNILIIERNFHKIRNYVNESEKVTLPHDGVLFISASQNIKSGLHILKSPEDFRSYLIVFQVKIKAIIKTVGVPFPGPGEIGWERYSNLKNIVDTRFDFTDITSRDYIDNERFVDAYDYLYKNVK